MYTVTMRTAGDPLVVRHIEAVDADRAVDVAQRYARAVGYTHDLPVSMITPGEPRYWTIAYTYGDGRVIRQGAYSNRSMADMNARLNAHLSARVEGVW
jgi:hypothetical protein